MLLRSNPPTAVELGEATNGSGLYGIGRGQIGPMTGAARVVGVNREIAATAMASMTTCDLALLIAQEVYMRTMQIPIGRTKVTFSHVQNTAGARKLFWRSSG